MCSYVNVLARLALQAGLENPGQALHAAAKGPQKEGVQECNIYGAHGPQHWWHKVGICANAWAPVASHACHAQLARSEIPLKNGQWT